MNQDFDVEFNYLEDYCSLEMHISSMIYSSQNCVPTSGPWKPREGVVRLEPLHDSDPIKAVYTLRSRDPLPS